MRRKLIITFMFIALAVIFELWHSSLKRQADNRFVMLCGKCNLPEITKALNSGANPNAVNDKGDTPLTATINTKTREMIYEIFITTESQDVGRLMDIAEEWRLGTVKALLEAGADPNKAGRRGILPIVVAAEKGYVGVIHALLDGGANINAYGYTALAEASKAGHVEAVKTLIMAGANLNAPKGGYTPLMNAAMRGHDEIINTLIANGANVNATTKYGD